MTPDATNRACAHTEGDRPIPTEPDGEPGAVGGELCPVHDVVMGGDVDPSTAEIDLEDVDPKTYPQDLVANGARWLLWQARDGRKAAEPGVGPVRPGRRLCVRWRGES